MSSFFVESQGPIVVHTNKGDVLSIPGRSSFDVDERTATSGNFKHLLATGQVREVVNVFDVPEVVPDLIEVTIEEIVSEVEILDAQAEFSRDEIQTKDEILVPPLPDSTALSGQDPIDPIAVSPGSTDSDETNGPSDGGRGFRGRRRRK